MFSSSHWDPSHATMLLGVTSIEENENVELVDTVVVTEICVTSGHSTRFIVSEHISGVWSNIDSLSDTVYGREFSIYIITCIVDVDIKTFNVIYHLQYDIVYIY